MQLFSVDATIFVKRFKKKFVHKKLKKMPQKLLRNTQKNFHPELPNGPNKRIHFPKCSL